MIPLDRAVERNAAAQNAENGSVRGADGARRSRRGAARYVVCAYAQAAAVALKDSERASGASVRKCACAMRGAVRSARGAGETRVIMRGVAADGCRFACLATATPAAIFTM